MRITPKKEEELSKFDLVPDGEWPFTVIESDEIASNSVKNKGKMMYALKLNVHGPNGDRHVYDYFADWFSEWKLRHFAATVGRLSNYEAGDLDGSLGAFNGLTGYVKLGHEEAKGNYGAKNVCQDYIVKEKGVAAPKSEPESEDEKMPF